MQPIYYSTEYNTTFNWHAGDIESHFNANKDKLLSMGWNSDSIEYYIDHNGFRNPKEIDISKSYIVLGCSHAFGVGIRYDDTWAQKLSKMMGISIYNASIPGGSADSSFRALFEILDQATPLGVIHLVPTIERQELYKFGCLPVNYGTWCYEDPEYKHIVEFTLENRAHMLNRTKNLFGIQYLCDKNQIPCHSFLLEKYDNLLDGMARDLVHSGPEANTIMAETFYDNINNIGL